MTILTRKEANEKALQIELELLGLIKRAKQLTEVENLSSVEKTHVENLINNIYASYDDASYLAWKFDKEKEAY